MAQKPKPKTVWYLNEWLVEKEINQTALVELTGWPKSKASDVMNGKQRYTHNIIDDLAKALNLEPYQLLMHPSEALAMDRMRDAAVSIAATKRDARDVQNRQG